MCIRWERDLYSSNNLQVNLPQRVFFFITGTMLCPLEKLWYSFLLFFHSNLRSP
ncbi:hypothetical protein Peur_065312 [Populus x canadensis]